MEQEKQASRPKFRVKFVRGPLHGQTREYDRESPTVTVLGWKYEATGRRDGDYWLYVLRSKSRIERRIVAMVAEQSGSDPRLLPREQPVKVIRRGRNEPCWCGSGKKFKRCHG